MKPDTETKVTFAFWGMVGGAAIAMIIGFNWGGWTTSSSAQKITEDAILASRAAICVAQFMHTPELKVKIKELQDTDSYQRTGVIETGGWDKMPGQEKAAWGVSSACLTGIEAQIKAKT